MNTTGTERGETDAAQSQNLSMTLRTRTPVCGARTTTIDRLSRLRATEVIDAFEVRTWPDEVVLSAETGHDDVVETFERFEAWADERGLSIRPGFDVRTTKSFLQGERTVLTLPMMCLSVVEDDELVGVFPCRDGKRTWTIDDCLTAHERGESVQVLEPGAR